MFYNYIMNSDKKIHKKKTKERSKHRNTKFRNAYVPFEAYEEQNEVFQEQIGSKISPQTKLLNSSIVYVKFINLGGNELSSNSLPFNLNTTIRTLKEFISQNTGINTKDLIIFYNGKIINNNVELIDIVYIQNRSTIEFTYVISEDLNNSNNIRNDNIYMCVNCSYSSDKYGQQYCPQCQGDTWKIKYPDSSEESIRKHVVPGNMRTQQNRQNNARREKERENKKRENRERIQNELNAEYLRSIPNVIEPPNAQRRRQRHQQRSNSDSDNERHWSQFRY